MPKQKLSIDEQINHMKITKGILFNIIDESTAKQFLLNNNYYFRVKAYAKNYDRYINGNNKGKYINLEFAYLLELSTLDMHFRKLILKMTIDIEHYLKTKLMRDFESNENEDGYALIEDLFTQYPNVKENIEKQRKGSYCRDLVDKYRDEFALWNIVEVISFGELINLYMLYYSRYPSGKSMSEFLWSVRFLRNAAAHNNCLLNSLKTPYTRSSVSYKIAKYISQIPGISKNSRVKKLSNPVIYDFVVTLHVFSKIVTSEKVKMHMVAELRELIKNRFTKNINYFSKNEVVNSTFEFMGKVVDFYCQT